MKRNHTLQRNETKMKWNENHLHRR